MNLDNHIRYMGLQNKNYQVLDEKVKEIIFLKEVIDTPFVKEKFQQVSDLIKQEI